MDDRGKGKARQEEHRVVFAEHRERRGGARGDRPSGRAGLERAQEAPGRQRPGRQQDRVGIEPLRMELVDRHQHEQQQHDEALVATHEATRDQVDEPQADSRIGQRHQIQRPVGERKDRGPGPRDPPHQRRMLGIAPIPGAAERPCFQNVRVQVAVGIGEGHIDEPDRDKADQQQRNAPSPLRCRPSTAGTAFASARRRTWNARRTRGYARDIGTHTHHVRRQTIPVCRPHGERQCRP